MLKIPLLPLAFCFSLFAVATRAADEPPTDWVDPATGHRVVRLSREPGSASLYFHQNAYSPDGKKLVITSPSGISTIDLETHAIDLVVPGKVRALMTGRKSNRVYYLKEGVVWASDLATHAATEIAKLPPQLGEGNLAINADETMLVGIGLDRSAKAVPRPLAESAEVGLAKRWAAGSLLVTYTIDLKSGALKKIHEENDWTNHLQCSPTDPDQIMFCHEGPWEYNDRTWLLRTDGTQLTQVHHRTMEMEIAGHEFFNGDGKTIWYDLQTPRSMDFWLAGYEIATHQRTWYHLERNEWSVHYNVSRDGTLFAGDGGGPTSVANQSPNGERLDPPGNGQWIYLFHPVLVKNRAAFIPGQGQLIQTGYFRSERMVDLSKHKYNLEPNVTFSPDGKWLIFRSNMFGPSHVFAVEIAKAK